MPRKNLLERIWGNIWTGKPKRPKARKPKARRRNPLTDREKFELEQAYELSERFHGQDTEVVELSEQERRLPRFAVALGKVPDLAYEPRNGSKRGNATYEHKSGDFGNGKSSHKKPTLVVDPCTGKPHLITGESPMRMDPDAGLRG